MSLSLISGSGGSRVSLAVQIPASVFIVSKDFCASEFGAGVSTALYACVSDWGTDFCASDCAKATVESDIRPTDSIKRRDFMFHSPVRRLNRRGVVNERVIRM